MGTNDITTKNIRKGVFWNSINSIAKYGLVFIGTIVLARILTPEDYGLIGIMTIFITVAEVLIDSGLGGAIIKKKQVSEIDYSTLTVYNGVTSIIIYVIFYFSAPFISKFYDKPILEDLLRLYSIVILIFSITIVPRVRLIKQLQFKTLSIISLVAGICGLITAICLALMGFGVISLIWQYIINALVTSILLWTISKYKIKLKFSYQSFKEQFAFGMSTTLANSLKAISDNIYANVIGKISTITQTGYYSQSLRLANVPTNFLFNLIDSTFFPIFSQQTDKNDFIVKFNKINIRTVQIIIILFGAAFSICKELIHILLGDQWIEATHTLEILLISSMFISLANIGRNILKCLGETFLILKVEGYLFILSLILLSIVIFQSYYYVVYAFLVVSIIKAISMCYISYRKLNISIITFIKPTIKVMIWTFLAILLACSVNYLNLAYYISLILKLFIFILTIGIWYIGFSKTK